MSVFCFASFLFFLKERPIPKKTRSPSFSPPSPMAPSSVSPPAASIPTGVGVIDSKLELKELEYGGQLKNELLTGMPEGTEISLTYRSSFLENGRNGLFVKDILLVETVLSNGDKYAFHASYDTRLGHIVRTWGGGGHDRSGSAGLSLRKP
ncbi:MAG: hypothetical protein OXB88_08150 [Bacteriovoracales bacterium]|nr:hypothetical protein [Bacteriovoracales bacterium]